MATFLTIVLLIALFIFWKTAVVVPMREGYVKERLGKFAGVLEPGLHILVPFVDRVAYRHERREQVLDVHSQTCITRDNIQVEVDGLIYIKVVEPDRASYGIGDYRTASVNLAQTTMRSEIGKLALHQALSERDSLNENIVRELDKASDPWGVKVMRYELRNINPSAHVVHTLEKQMEAERERRAEVTRATAAKEVRIAVSEGERQEAINLSEGERQKRINEAEGRANAIEVIATATAQGMREVGAAIARPGGDQAQQIQRLQSYLAEVGTLLARSEVSIVPPTLANIQGAFEGFESVAAQIAGKTKAGD